MLILCVMFVLFVFIAIIYLKKMQSVTALIVIILAYITIYYIKVFSSSGYYQLTCDGLFMTSFVTKVMSWGRQQRQLRLVSDQVSNPTWCRMLAEINAQLLAKAGDDFFNWFLARRGIYHLAGDGYASRLDWGKAILENDPHREEQVVENLIPAQTVDFPTPAERPLFSALSKNFPFGLYSSFSVFVSGVFGFTFFALIFSSFVLGFKVLLLVN